MDSEFESDLRDTVDWGRKWLVDFNAEKTQLVSFDWSKNTGAIDVKMNGSVVKACSVLSCPAFVCTPIAFLDKVKKPVTRYDKMNCLEPDDDAEDAELFLWYG